jgi:hypothetical protein
VDPQILRAGLRIAVLVLLLAVVTLPFQPWGSAESVVTVLAAATGLIFVVAIAVLARLSSPPLPDDSARPKGYNGRSTKERR